MRADPARNTIGGRIAARDPPQRDIDAARRGVKGRKGSEAARGRHVAG